MSRNTLRGVFEKYNRSAKHPQGENHALGVLGRRLGGHYSAYADEQLTDDQKDNLKKIIKMHGDYPNSLKAVDDFLQEFVCSLSNGRGGMFVSSPTVFTATGSGSGSFRQADVVGGAGGISRNGSESSIDSLRHVRHENIRSKELPPKESVRDEAGSPLDPDDSRTPGSSP